MYAQAKVDGNLSVLQTGPPVGVHAAGDRLRRLHELMLAKLHEADRMAATGRESSVGGLLARPGSSGPLYTQTINRSRAISETIARQDGYLC